MDASPEARARRLDAAIALRWDSGKAFAQAAGFDPAEVSRWRSGTRTPGRDKLAAIAPLVDRSVDWLIAGDDLTAEVTLLQAKLDLALDALGVERPAMGAATDAGADDSATENVRRPKAAEAARAVQRGVRTPQPEAPERSQPSRRAR